jgi:hypothetical protein
MIVFPEPPELPASQTTTAETRFRYEDISQEGRIKVTGLPHALGDSVWQNLLASHPVQRAAARSGVAPILSRMVLWGGEDPVPVQRPARVAGAYHLAHTVDGTGAVNRLILNLWADLDGTIGLTQGPRPPRAGQPSRLGRVFAEHVFTRPLAPAEQRKVLELPGPDGPWLPPDRHTWVAPSELLGDPAGPDAATPWEVDPAPVVFGLLHTDSNQHVNSLVYPRIFEEAVERVLALRDPDGPPVLARVMEVAFRKPGFAGQRVRQHVALVRHGDGSVTAAGVLLPEGAPPPASADDGGRRAYCVLRAVFRPAA